MLKRDSPLLEASDSELLATVLTPQHLHPALADLLDAFVTGMTTQFKDMYAWFMWQEHARKHATNAFQVLHRAAMLFQRMHERSVLNCLSALG